MKRTMVLALTSICLFLMGACGGIVRCFPTPAAPTNLQVDSTTQDSVTLSWIDNAADEAGFYVESAFSAVGPFTTLATLGQDVETYTQSTLSSGTYYYYRVCSYNADGDSPYSDVVLATTQSAPGGGYQIPAVADSLSEIELYAYDSGGYWTTELNYYDPGPDNAWGTSDDPIGHYTLPIRNPDGTPGVTEHYWDPGIDGDWFTGDDLIGVNTMFIYSSTGDLIERNRFNDPGSDGTWGTGDDLMFRYEYYYYDSSGRRTEYIRYDDTGADGTWFTADDVVYQIYKYTYNTDGKIEQRIQSRNPGIDGDWFTTDDVIYDYTIYEYDLYGMLGRRIKYNNGIDGDWFTNDDEIKSHATHVHDSKGNELGIYHYDGPGTDGVWFQ